MLNHLNVARLTAILLFTFVSPVFAQSTLPDPSGDYGYGEELLRGPVHEAFAEQFNQEPIEGIVVDRVPPPLVPEVPPEVRPEGNNIEWVSGYWFWDEDRSDFIWVSGVWRQMPPGQRFVPGYWAEVSGRHQWVSGYWVATTVAQVDYIAQSPPQSLDLGPVGNAPSEQHFWIPGCWTWRDVSYAWRPGYWSVGQSNWVWVPERYLWTPRGYVFCNGYWDYPIASRGTVFAPFWFNRPVYTQVGFSHVPRLSLFASAIQSHFWVNPRCHHYYFGDYYAASYRNAGYYPWHSYHRRSSISFGGRNHWGYDPLFAYSSRVYESRGTNLTIVLGNQYNVFVNQSDRRPPRTYLEQRSRGPSSWQDYRREDSPRGSSFNDSFWTRSDVLGESIRERQRREPTQFTRLTDSQIDRYRVQANAIPQLASLRQEVESRDRDRSGRVEGGLVNPRLDSNRGRDDSPDRRSEGDISRGDRSSRFQLPPVIRDSSNAGFQRDTRPAIDPRATIRTPDADAASPRDRSLRNPLDFLSADDARRIDTGRFETDRRSEDSRGFGRSQPRADERPNDESSRTGRPSSPFTRPVMPSDPRDGRYSVTRPSTDSPSREPSRRLPELQPPSTRQSNPETSPAFRNSPLLRNLRQPETSSVRPDPSIQSSPPSRGLSDERVRGMNRNPMPSLPSLDRGPSERGSIRSQSPVPMIRPERSSVPPSRGPEGGGARFGGGRGDSPSNSGGGTARGRFNRGRD